jgi:Ni/Co efflux regulator RcnB
MKPIQKIFAFTALAATLSGGLAFADDHHDDHHYVKHEEWKKGYHMKHEDWDRGTRIDYRTYHLRRPPSGYEWREVDGNYVLAAIATGVIVSTVLAAETH